MTANVIIVSPLLFLLLLLATIIDAQETAKIGVLVEQPSSSSYEGTDMLSLRNGSITEVLDMALLYARSHQLTGRIHIIPIYENGITFLNLYEKACQLLSQGVVALVAPSVPSMAPLVAAIGTKYGILTILPASLSNDPTVASTEALIASRATSPLSSSPLSPGVIGVKPGPISQPPTTQPPLMISDSTSVVIRPRQDFIADAIEDFIVTEKWDSFTIIYEDPNALAYLQSLLHLGRPRVSDFYLESHSEHVSGTAITATKTIADVGRSGSGTTTITYHVFLRQLRPAAPGSSDYRPLLKDLRESGVSRFIIDCRASSIASFLQQALQVNMLNVYFHYFFTSLDAHLVDYAAYWYGGANITYLQVANQTKNIQTVEERIAKFAPSQAPYPPPNTANMDIKPLPRFPRKSRRWTAADLFLFDGILSMANAIGNLSRVQKLDSTPIICDRQEPAEYKAVGENLLNYMRTTVDLSGLTGLVNIDERGWRTSIALDVARVNRQDGTMERYAEWLPNNGGIKIVATLQSVRKEAEPFFRNKTLIVTTIAEEPFVMFKTPQPGEILEGNDRFQGYCVDLMKKLAETLHFKYEIKLVDDGQYGAPVDPSAMRWNGMVGELLSKKADIAIAPLTITYVREQVIDFTTPYMNLGISILYRKPKQETPTLFSFMNPLEYMVWIYVLGAYVATSIILYIVARVTPYEWVRKPACAHEPNTAMVENQFTLFNSLWFTISSLMQQGCDIAPRAFSTRIIGSVWSFFTLIIISSYTANLAAFLTIERLQTDISSAEDLAKQKTDVKYGTRSSGSTMTFFKNSKIPTYEKMWNYMSTAQPTVFVNSSNEGIARVKAGGYAFLMESTMIEYNAHRDCELMQVGGLLDSKGYGIGLPRGSPLRENMSNAILKLQEDQFLHVLKIRWWMPKTPERAGKQCDTGDGAKTSTSQLGISQVGGVFACLVIGLAVGILLSIFEFCYRIKRRQMRSPPGITFGQQMLEQCRLILHFKSVKAPPIAPHQQLQQSSIRSQPGTSTHASRISHASRTSGPSNKGSLTEGHALQAPLLPIRFSTSVDNQDYHDQGTQIVGGGGGGIHHRHQPYSSGGNNLPPSGFPSSTNKQAGNNPIASKSLNDIKYNAQALSTSTQQPSRPNVAPPQNNVDTTNPSPYFLQY